MSSFHMLLVEPASDGGGSAGWLRVRLVGWSVLVCAFVCAFVSAFVCSFRGLFACVLSWVEIWVVIGITVRYVSSGTRGAEASPVRHHQPRLSATDDRLHKTTDRYISMRAYAFVLDTRL